MDTPNPQSQPQAEPDTAPPSQEKPAAPARVDGGLRAWLTILGGWICLFCTFGYSNAFGVYQDLYTRDGAASASRVSWVGSVQLFFLVGMGLPAGKLLDMGYFRQTILAGSLLYVFSLFMLSLAHVDKYYQIFLSQGLGMGIGGGLIYLPAVAIQAHHWQARRAFAIGIVFTGGSIGGIIFPIMLNQLFHNSVGFAWGVRASAFLILGLLVIANLIMSPRPPGTGKPPGGQAAPSGLAGMARDVPFLLVIFGAFCVNWGLFFPYFYIQLYSILHGAGVTFSFYTLAIMNGASILGRTIPNFLADTVGPFNNFVPACLGPGIMLFALLGIRSTAGIVVFAIIYGFFTGAFVSLLAPTIATLTANKGEIGLRMGVAFFLTSFGSLFGTPVQGALLGTTFTWSRPIIFSAVMSVAGTVGVGIARQMVARRKGSQVV
ncbi:MFS monocarboxylate transporter [Heterobasidion irregulare TC 32-1]|uniref:MFS monocarboxylate transporter n=1 Tax=Heterobasidion irregulare (strain TC 32-1) TaxID=747525 RepID=W4KI37_HETIT|nr:MFS monocarboxylate transporter [Heterobasidion irregulare TC 32-1]ETW84736.1 MFS monocarboxylate transporter [Heterobasidion irregulare TC 32-1]